MDYNQKIKLHNLCPWEVTFPLKNSPGEIVIPPYGTYSRIDAEEIKTQVDSGNRLLKGTDGYGSHAQIYIENEELRRELEFDTDEKQQMILNEDVVKKIFALKTPKVFEKHFAESVVTDAERHLVMALIKKLDINDHARISFAESYTGIKLSA